MNVLQDRFIARERGIGQYYQDVAFGSFRALVRRKLLIVLCIVVGVALGGILVTFLPRTYDAKALFYPSFTVGKGNDQTASLSGTGLVSSEVEKIRSPMLAKRVAEKLNLDVDKEFLSPRDSRWSWLHKLRLILLPETAYDSNLSRAAAELQKRLDVRSDTRTYVIGVRVRASTPQLAANIVNAILVEHVRFKVEDRALQSVATAKRDLASLSAIYEHQHPKVIRARAGLAEKEHQLSLVRSENGIPDNLLPEDQITLAEPNATPSSPAGKVILGLAALLGLVAGVGAAHWLNGRDNGFESPSDVVAHTRVPCVGRIPQVPEGVDPSKAIEIPAVRTALRAGALEAGLLSNSCLNKVVMITTTELDRVDARFAELLARVLVSESRRVLVIELDTGSATDQPSQSQHKLRIPDEEKIEEEADGLQRSCDDFFEANRREKFARLAVSSDVLMGFGSAELSRLIVEGKKRFDIVVVASPLLNRLTDTALIGRTSDLKLLVAVWKRTPRKAVQLAINRLLDFNVSINGIILADVNVNKLRSSMGVSEAAELL